MRYPPQKNTEIVRLLSQQGRTEKELGAYFHVHPGTIWRWRKMYNIPRQYTRKSNIILIIELMKQTTESGFTMMDIVHKTGINRKQMYWIFRNIMERGLIRGEGVTTARRWYWIGGE